MKRLLRILDITLTTVLLLIIVSSTYLAVSARRSADAIPTVFGHKVFSVLSGSMEPAIKTGDVILVRPLLPDETLSVGEIITYRVAGQPAMLITHRVVGIVAVNGKPAAYTTRGDANETGDGAVVMPDRIVGRYHWRVPYFGYITSFMRTPLGIVLVVIVPGLILIGMEIRRLWRIMAEVDAAKPKENHSSPSPPG